MAKAKGRQPKKWIQGAGIKKGALTEMAKQAGFTTWQAFCAQPDEKLSTTAKRRCNLAKTLGKLG